MNIADRYTFHIDAYTPETIPMARLASYLGGLASLLGEEKSVHFQAVEPGSTRLACEVEHEATYKVYKRVARAPSADARTPEGRAYRHIEHLLREDSAGARLNRNKENVIDFPRSQRQESSAIKLTQQKISHVGTLVGIGGRDATAHAMLTLS